MLLSIVMPAYNAASYIGKSIQSVLNQTHKELELIVVNDGSVDNTEEIVRTYMAQDSRIVLVNKKNGGMSDARNAGINVAKGGYIAFLDSDDLYHKEFLERTYAYIKAHPGCELVYARIQECFLDGSTKILGAEEIQNGFLEDYIYKSNEFRLTSNHSMCYLISRDLLEKYHVRYDMGYLPGEDTGLHLKILCLTKYHGMDDILGYYIHRENSVTDQPFKPETCIGQIVAYDNSESYMLKYRPQAADAFYKSRNYVVYRYILRSIRLGYIENAQQRMEVWKDRLEAFANSDGKLNDRLKCKLLLMFNKSARMLRIIGRL